jgi:hypothetical protein
MEDTKTIYSAVYLICAKEYGEYIYKISGTKNIIILNDCIFMCACSDYKFIKSEVVKIFKKKYIHRKDIGRDYFKGDYNNMINDIHNIIGICDEDF